MSAFEKVEFVEFAGNNERRTWRPSLLRAVSLLMAVGVLTLATSAQAAVISFETSEGFPAAQGNIEGAALPAAFVDSLDSSELPNTDPGVVFVTGASGNNPFGEGIGAVSGTQYGALNGAGSITLTIDLKNSANLSLDSFWYANRGSFVPGVTVEYFDLLEASLGTESFSGSTDGGAGLGLNAGFSPEFDKITVSLPAALGVALSKVTITSTTTSSTGHASFFIDDISLTPVVPEPSSFVVFGLGGIVAFALRRGKR